MLELYHALTSTCSQKVRMCLFEKELPWIDHPVNLAANEHLTEAYLAMNPNGVVPTLVHDGHAIVDSSVICEYLDEVFPRPRLVPEDPVRRAQLRAWMRFLEEVPTAAIRVPSFHMALAQRYARLSDAEFRDEVADIRPLRKHFYHRMGTEGFGRDDVEASLDELRHTMARMEKTLVVGPWIMGEDFTLADIVVMPSIDRLADLGLARMWEDQFPLVTAWYARLRARPAFAKTYAPGSRLSETMTIRPLAWAS